jgi:hypothetical protein
VAVIELARKEGKNPDVSEWLEEGYFSAIRELAKLGAVDFLRAESPEAAGVILSVLATERRSPNSREVPGKLLRRRGAGY